MITQDGNIFDAIQHAETREANEIIINYVKQIDSSETIKNSVDNRLLHQCIDSDKLQLMIDLLALEKLPINAMNDEGQTPLFYSLDVHKGEFAIKLIEAGADVNISDELGILPLHLVMGRDSRYARLLLKNGAVATMNAQDQYGKTPLHYAAEFEDLENVCLLLFYGAETDIVCNAGFSPFMAALAGSNHQLQEILLEYECDFDRQSEDGLLLDTAMRYESPFVLDIINQGADINTSNILIWSCESGNLDLFKELWRRKIFENNAYSRKVLKYITIDTEFLELVIESEELPYAMQFLKTHGIIINILQLTEKGYSRDLAQKAVLVLLNYGLSLSCEDLQYIYHEYRSREYEDDEFFKVLLFMDYDFVVDFHLVPSVMFSTSKDIDDIVRSFIRELYVETHSFNREKALEQLTRYSVHLELYRKALDSAEQGYIFINDNLQKKLTSGFPRLLDLARNKIRNFIHLKYKIRNTRHFYTIVERLPVPKTLIGIIEYRKSIY